MKKAKQKEVDDAKKIRPITNETRTLVRELTKELNALKKQLREKYPQIPNLIVPVEKLAEAKEKAETEGNILNKYYADINSTVAANNENRG